MPRRTYLLRLRLPTVLICLLLLALTACQEPTIAPEAADAYVTGWATTVESTLLEQASTAATSRALKERLQAAAEADHKRVTRDDPPFDVFLDEVYAEREYKPGLVEGGKLTERGAAVWTALQQVERHLLDVEKYPLEQIAGRLAELEQKRESFTSFDKLTPSPDELEFLRGHLVTLPASQFELTDDNHAELTRVLMESPQGARLEKAIGEYEEMSARKAAIEVELEHLLARGLVRYAREMKHFRIPEIFIHPRHDDFYNEPEIRSRRPDAAKGPYEAGVRWRRAAEVAEAIAKEKKPAILHERVRQTLRDVLGGDDATGVIAALAPSQPQYAGLLAEYERYSKIVEAGGWEQVEVPRTLNPGARSPVVAQLKRRLQIEGYYPADAPIDNHYDDALTRAIRTYQETHQMDTSGRPHAVFWRSVNVPAERRLAQIGINIKRWRESNVVHELPHYAFVNVPDFTIETWRNQERTMRFGVIVGGNDLVVDPLTEEKRHANRTPVPMAAYIDRLIYNPYWNVTPRLRAANILPQVKKAVEKEYAAKLEALARRNRPAQPLVPQLAEVGGMMPGGGGQGAEAPVADNSPVFTSTVSGGGVRFNMQAVRRVKLASAGAGEGYGELTSEELAQMFPYLNPETGEVDVSVTKPDHIPAWYAQNGYEVMFPGRTWEYVRMLPGGENSLGLVKIIFPNYEDVYLHDTPAKSLFRHDLRAFSAGCIRLENPLGLAEYLLTNDGQWESAKVPEKLKSGEYWPVFLKRQVPIFLEYYTVRVDDEGRANFLSDVYGYDKL